MTGLRELLAHVDGLRDGERARVDLLEHPPALARLGAKIVGAGISDIDTLQYLARLLGDQEITQGSATAGETGRRSTTESSAFRALAPAHLVREGKPGTAPARLRQPATGAAATATVVLRPDTPPTGDDLGRRSGLDAIHR
jgi:hypothetical protein